MAGSESLTPPMRHPGESVSVIVIARNAARYIASALASVQASTVAAAEILVVDGGSTDGTRALAESVAGVRVIDQRSPGIAQAYNEGIAASQGSLVAFLSADDIWLPGKLERQLERLRAEPDTLICVSLVEHFLEPGCVIPPGFRPELLTAPRPGLLMETLVARREAFSRVGGFDPGLSTAEDTDWFARAKDAGLRIAMVDEVLVRKRVHDHNASLVDACGHRNRLRLLRASLARKRAAAHARISVIIPCHNDGPFLAAAIQSAMEQTVSVGEILVVDDGSTDDTAAIAARFAPRLRYLRQAHAGIASARNLGLRAALGDHLAFLDADDLWPPRSLEWRLRALEGRPDVAAVLGATEEFCSLDDPSAALLERVARGPRTVRLAGAMLIRRSLATRLGEFDESLAVGEWIDWMARLTLQRIDVATVPELVLRRRIHAGNATGEIPQAWSAYLTVLRTALRRRAEST